MGLALSLGFYAGFLFFVAGYLVRMLNWMQQAPQPAELRTQVASSPVLRGLADILLLRRLLRVNSALWLGEWVFHLSLAVLFVRHLRFIVEPVPAFVICMDVPARIAAWLLPASLLYIGLMKVIIEKKPYVSSYNFYLLGLLLVSGISGLAMKYLFRADLMDIKYFSLGIVTFHATSAPASPVFLLHFAVFLLLLAGLPSHVVAAPLTMVAARQRDDELRYLMHEK